MQNIVHDNVSDHHYSFFLFSLSLFLTLSLCIVLSPPKQTLYLLFHHFLTQAYTLDINYGVIFTVAAAHVRFYTEQEAGGLV